MMVRTVCAVLTASICVAAPAHSDGPTLDAAFLGDSYSLGAGSTDISHRWTTLVAEQEGWFTELFAAGGSGYVASTATSTDLRGRIPALVAAHPEVVVVSGGLNDWSALLTDPAGLFAAVDDTYRELRAGLPDARIIAIGPTFPGGPNQARLEFDGAVETSSSAVGGQFISLLRPPVITIAMVEQDGTHVNDDGHAAIAERVTSHL